MAYNKGFNPDRLPMHAEPEQAAQMLSSGAGTSNTNRPPRTSSARPDYGKPTPPQPPSQPHASSRHDLASQRHDYHRQEYSSSTRPAAYEARPPPGAFQTNPRYDSHGRGERYGVGSPPPANYGHGPPPQGYHGRPPIAAQHRPPPTPAPPRDGNDREALWRLFGAVDKDNNGSLTEAELRTALVNGDWSPFDPHTVRMMIRMFDTDRSGRLSFDEFCGLWGFLSAWRGLFDRFDADHSGTISYAEFNEALIAFGYRLSQGFVTLLYQTYDRSGRNALSFDLFVQACISLKRMTDVFKKYDEDRDGYITLSL
ncbi:hypothetical protein ACEQ8H_005841 [Pleosporales sp. CAS-2024a]